jgi:hypothetical protein
MAKITLKEQLHNLTYQEELTKESHLQEFFETNSKPEKLFKIDHIGTIKEIELLRFAMGYIENGRNIYPPYVDKEKRPSSSLIEVYSNYIDKIQTVERIIYVHYKDFGSGAFRFNEVLPEKGISFNENDLKEISERRNQLYAPKENHTACCYCRKQTPNDQLIESTIIGRGRKQTWNSWKNRYEDKACVTQEKLKFCSGQCAGNEQMSREG